MGRMTATITVQGTHTAWFDAERATVHISAAFDGAEARRGVRPCDPGRRRRDRADHARCTTKAKGPVTWWSSDRVNVWSERPWNNEGKRLPLVFHATIGMQAKFNDFDALSRLIEQVAVMDGVNVGGIDWDLTDDRRTAETDAVRRAAVADAVQKAATYAAAAGLGTPVGDRGRRPRHAGRRHRWRGHRPGPVRAHGVQGAGDGCRGRRRPEPVARADPGLVERRRAVHRP